MQLVFPCAGTYTFEVKEAFLQLTDVFVSSNYISVHSDSDGAVNIQGTD